MVDKAAAAIGIIAIVLAASSFAYTASSLGTLSEQVKGVANDLSGVKSTVAPLQSAVSPLQSGLESVRQEQGAIRSLVEQRVGNLDKALQEAQQRLAQAEKTAQESQKELEALKADQALEDAAKGENVPVFYGNMDAPHFVNIVWPRFRESYPWAPAEPRYVQGFTALANRFATEFQSNAPSADIVIQGQGLTSGLLGQYYQPFPDFKFRDVYPEALPYPNKSKAVAFPLTQNAVVLIHNTEVVKEADAPKGWLALADPAWKGKFVIHDPRQLTTPTNFFAEMFLVLGQDRWNTYMRDVAANAPTLVGSSTEAYVKVVSGEFPVGLALINDILNQKPGTPVRIAYPTEEPIGLTIVPSTFIGISQKAASPNFAKLFVIWALSPPGQRAVGDTGRMPTLSILDHPLSPGKVIPPGVKPFPLNPEIVTNPKKWGDLMKSFFG